MSSATTPLLFAAQCLQEWVFPNIWGHTSTSQGTMNLTFLSQLRLQEYRPCPHTQLIDMSNNQNASHTAGPSILRIHGCAHLPLHILFHEVPKASHQARASIRKGPIPYTIHLSCLISGALGLTSYHPVIWYFNIILLLAVCLGLNKAAELHRHST